MYEKLQTEGVGGLKTESLADVIEEHSPSFLLIVEKTLWQFSS